MIELESAVQELTSLLDGVTDDRLGAPTPCPDLPVAALLDHIMGLSLAFTWGARKSDEGKGLGPGQSSADALDPEWRTVLPVRLAGLAEAWRDPAAWEGTAEVGGVRMPAQIMGVVALDEVVMHGWDLARATGQPYTVDAESAEAVLGFTSMSAQQGAAREGLFGPVVEVPANAPVFDRALGFAGRDPGWAPARS